MRRKTFPMLLILSLASIILLGCKQYSYGENTPAATVLAETKTVPTTQSTPQGYTVEITSAGFNPKELTVNAGDTVTFVNKDSSPHRPASAVHPTHSVYPESGGCIGSKFDACKNLGQGESWSFTFNQKGTWKYHDHLNPGFTGTIIVK